MTGAAGKQNHFSTAVMVIHVHGVATSNANMPLPTAVAGHTMAAHVEQAKTKCQLATTLSPPMAVGDMATPTKVLGYKAQDCHAKPA